MDAIFKRPYFNSAQFIEESGIPNRMTASRILEKLVEASILEEVKKQSGRRPSNYLFPELMGVVE
jgi:Fic family protein